MAATGPSAGASRTTSNRSPRSVTAVERGVNWIDTAAIYGLGHSEDVVRRALKDIPSAQRPFVFTKCGLRWDEKNRMAPPQNIGAPASIRAECEASP
ncbi:MAG: aldo/keto reductase [Hyphomicrobium sp.]